MGKIADVMRKRFGEYHLALWLPRPAEYYASGGCHPTLTHVLRALTSEGRFSRSAMTVARPIGVLPCEVVHPWLLSWIE